MMKVMFAIADANGDGALSFEEVSAIHKRVFDRVDVNKDGTSGTETGEDWVLSGDPASVSLGAGRGLVRALGAKQLDHRHRRDWECCYDLGQRKSSARPGRGVGATPSRKVFCTAAGPPSRSGTPEIRVPPGAVSGRVSGTTGPATGFSGTGGDAGRAACWGSAAPQE